MSWSDAFSSLPPSLKVIIAVLSTAVLSYVALVVVPTVPAIVEAIKQGRSATLVPLGIGEYEPPSVKKCKLVIENTNDSLRSLQDDFGKSVDLLKSQQIIVQDAINRRSQFMQLPESTTTAMNYTPGTVLQRLDNDVQSQENYRNAIADQVQGKVNMAIVINSRGTNKRACKNRYFENLSAQFR